MPPEVGSNGISLLQTRQQMWRLEGPDKTTPDSRAVAKSGTAKPVLLGLLIRRQAQSHSESILESGGPIMSRKSATAGRKRHRCLRSRSRQSAWLGGATLPTATRARSLRVEELEDRRLLSSVIFSETLDSDPGWTCQGQWAFGDPAGLGGTYYGNPDPGTGYTGSNVYGVNLSGNYSTSSGGPYYLTTAAINCSGYEDVNLKFWRWLNTDRPGLVPATVQVSNSGYAWKSVYSNTSSVTDNAWSQVTYDISTVADGQSTVYVRWGYRVFPSAYAYSGWNIDDVSLEGTDIWPPTVDSYTPADNATGVAISSNLVIDFSENVQKGTTGSILIKKTSDDSTVETIAVTDARVTISGDAATINPTSDLSAGTGYYVQVTSGAFEDLAGNDWTGVSGTTTWNFSTSGVANTDCGDAPDTAIGTGAGNYNTLSSDNGPSHVIVAGLYMGASVDDDDGTLQNAAADADDVNHALPDDEDGLNYPLGDLTLTIGAQPAVNVIVTNLTGSTATLFGWIDYNNNGLFDNVTERAQAPVANGTTGEIVTLTFPTVPEGFTGTTYARFRLSTDAAAANATGAALNGEVEDYVVTITTPASGSVAGTMKIASDIGGGPTLSSYSYFGSSVSTVGDLDSDGVTDLVVGAEGVADWRGALYVLLMNVDGTVKSLQEIGTGLSGEPILSSNDWFGSSVTSLGDLNGDGVTDLVVGADGDTTGGSYASHRGAVYVLMMNSDGTVMSSQKIASGTGGGPILADYDYFGSSVTALGDLDSDGVTDLAVGAEEDATAGPRRGAVYVLFMNPDGTAKSLQKIASGVGGGPTLSNYSYFGSSVSAMGDLDGDGITDLAVGARGDGTGGSLHVLFLNANGTVKSSQKIASGMNGAPTLASGDLFGTSITSPGDLDGDGITDLVVGARGDDSDRGALHVLLMNSDGTVKSTQKIASGISGGPTLNNRDDFGSSVTSLGDLNGDGLTDLAVGARGDDYDCGALHVLFLASFFDFGDAPDTAASSGTGNYNTLSTDNGPRHTIVAGLYMGASVDGDSGTLQNAAASADDNSGTDDEDGLSDPASDLTVTVGAQPTVDVTITNTTGATATLFGWIDYNNDGLFDNATERAQAAVATGTEGGTVTLTFPTVPTGFLGTTYARFRLSTDAAAADATGAASDGEVEDYVATIIELAPPMLAAEPATTLGTENTIAWSGVADADAYYVECDNDFDFTSVEATSGWIAATEYTFTGLTPQETYYYRVKARLVTAPGTTDSWMQTNQSQFEAVENDLANVDTISSPGDVRLAIGPSVLFRDGFEDGNYDGWEDGEDSVERGVTDMVAAEGNYSFVISGGNNSHFEGVSHTLSSLMPDRIDFSVFSVDSSAADGYFVVGVGPQVSQTAVFFYLGSDGKMHLNNGTVAPIYNAFQWYDISFIFDWGTKTFDWYVNDTLIEDDLPFRSTSVNWLDYVYLYNFNYSAACWDGITFSGAGYLTAGAIASETLSPDPFSNWNALTFSATAPAGTSLTVDLLDGSGALLAEDVGSGADLGALGITDTSIRLLANLSTTNPGVTPALHDWSVSWQATAPTYLESDWSDFEFSTQIAPSTAPDAVDLVATSDTGVDSSDDLTRLDNSTSETRLEFSVAGTVTGATVTVYADGTAIGSAVASGTTTTVTTDGTYRLSDGLHSFTARQVEPGKALSDQSAALAVTIDTQAPFVPNYAGELDFGFGGGGIVITDVSGSYPAYAKAVAIQEDGRTIVAGYAEGGFGSSYDFLIVRYNADGTLDSSFGSGGKVITDFGGDSDEAHAVIVQPDGKIVAAGYVHLPGYDHKFALVRYEADGTLDTEFGDNGVAGIDIELGGCFSALAVQADGKLLAAGYTTRSITPVWNDDFVLVRYNTDGSLDTDFGIDGIVMTDFYGLSDKASALAIQADGCIIVAGHANNNSSEFAFARYNPDGNLDSSFGDNGRRAFSVAHGSAAVSDLAIQQDGKIVAVGDAYFGSPYSWAQDFVVARLTSDGSLDSTLDGDYPIIGPGFVHADFGAMEYARGVAIQSDGRIVVAGYTVWSGTARLAMARYNTDGSLDTSFSDDGMLSTPIGTEDVETSAMVQLPDGRLLVVGSYGNTDFVVARYAGREAAPDLMDSSDSGQSDQDNVTTDITPSFSLQLFEAPYFRFYYDGSKISGDFETGTSYTLPPQADGTHDYTFFAVDAAGNQSTESVALSVTIDTAAPVVTVTSLTANDSTPVLTGTVSDGLFQVVVNGKTYTSGDGNLSVTGTDWTLQLPLEDVLDEGTYEVAASATDLAGNTGTDSTADELVIDITAPLSTIRFPGHGESYSVTSWEDAISGEASDDRSGLDRVEISIQQGAGNFWDGDGFYSANEYLLTAAGTTSWSLAFARGNFPADGDYTVYVQATDMAGNVQDSTVMFMFDNTVEIHGAKWNDLDADGVWDAGEPALADWIIYLDANGNGQVDVGERWARTDADGTYRLTDLAAGDYTVAEVVPDGWVQSYPSSGAVPGTHQVSLSEGQIVEDVDFGNWQAAEIHGAKWNDLDADGVWDAGEPGLAGWTIYLDQNGNGELDDGEPSTETLADDPATTEIDETGMYAFIDLFQGDYIVREVLQEGWDQSSPAGGAYVLTLAPGDILLEQDFGNYQLASISGHKWNDADVDGVWDVGELPLPGRTIYVDLDNDGQWDDPEEPSAVTGSDGSYTIAGVEPGEYTIRAVTDSGWFSSLPIVGPGAEFRVNTTAAGDQQRPTIAMAPDGSSVIAWQGIMDVAHNEILLQRYSADGTPVGDEIRHTPSTGTPYDNPAMAMDTEGNVSIAYRYGVSAYEWIAIGRYWADGTERGGLTATNVRGDYSSPSVAVSRDGKLAAVWRNSSSEVYARIWDVDDTTLAGPFQVDSSGAYATVAWGRDDQFIVAWQQGEEIYARIYEVDGTPVGDAFRVNTYTSGVQAAPSIASDGIGNFVVSWYSNEQDGEGGGIFARLYRADGTPAGEEFQVNTHWEGAQIAPSVSMQPDGHFVIAWQSRYQDGDGYGIYAQAFRPDGAPLGREMQVNTYTLGDQSDPSVTVSMSEEYGLGDFIVTWQSDDQDGDGTGIYARRFSPATPYYALVLDSGEVAQDIDFGSFQGFQPAEIHGAKWNDLNADGVWDAGEPGLADWIIYLDANGNGQVDVGERWARTDADGTYRLTDLAAGDYTVAEVIPDGWVQSYPSSSGVPGTHQVSLSEGQIVENINFGNWQAAEIHGAKWNDLDADGVWDAGEPGLAGWTIYLDQNGNGELDDGEPSTETLADDPATTEIDETGMYAFIDLFQGDYIVREVLQEGWDQSSPAGGAYVLTLAPGDILLEQDFGNYQLASISGHKWNDADVDGVWDVGELPLPGRTIYVDLDNDGQWDDPEEPSAVTGSDGSYTIAGVEPGEYTIRAVTDSGWFSSLPIVGPGAEFRVNTTAAGDQQRPTIAMAPDGSSVIAWQGIMDVAHNEILLQRYSADGTPVGDEIRHTPSTGTPYDNPAMAMDTEGNVSIAYRYGVSAYEWIAIGRYWADGTERGGLTATNVRGDYSSPSVAVSRDGKLAAVWRNSSSEVYARIWDVDDTTLAGPFQVDSSGAYATVAWGRDDQFIVAWQQGEEIYARIYEVDGTPVGDAFRVNTYTSGVQAAPSIASDGIGNFVVSWYSNEQDGEGGGIFARLYRADGTPAGEEFQVNTHWEGAQIAPSVSMQPDGHFVIAWQSRYQDGDGYGIYAQAFRPDGAPLGREMQVNTYTLGDQSDPSVTVSMSEEYGLGDFIVTWQSDDQDGDGTGIYARRFSPATPYYALVLDSGEVAQDIDFGSFQGFQPAEIHGAKWNDLNADGVWDAGEPGLADWIIYLDANGNGQVDVGERWARTDADGTYRLTDLAAGDYTVAEVIPDGWVQSYPSSSGVPGTHQVSLSEGQIVENINFGNWQAAEIHGAKWNDLDADGVWDAGEPGLAGWTIYLDQNGNGELDDGEPSTETLADDPATTEIDETGMYAFIDLFQGDYIVREVLQEGWDQSSPAGGAYVLTLAPGDILLEQDFGNYQLASISGHKWNDADVDGVWDAGEPPLEGQTIYVDLDNDGQWDDPDEPSAVTASDGSYTIGDVKPGEYTIRAVTDSGWFSSLPIVGPGAEFRVNTTAAGDQQRPTIAMAPDGSSVIAWQGIMDVAHNEILLQRYSADGTPVGDEIRHTPSTGTPYDNPAMAMDTEGNVSIAYRYGVSAYEWIAIGRYWADGTERGGLTATNVRGDYSSPSVAVSRDGKLAAVWRNSSSEVYARIWDVDDTTLAGPFQVDSSGAYATVAWGRDDQFIVAWQQGEEIYARIYEVDGTPVGDAFRVNTYTSGVQAAPSIASDGIGNFVVSWYSNEQDGEGGGIFARLYRADGTPAGEEFQVNTHWEGAQIAPSVSMQPDGHFVIAWQSRYQDGDGYGIYAQAFRPDGAPLGREMQVNTYTLGDQSDPSVTVSMSEEYGLGDFIVTWQSDDQDGDGTGIYARRFSPATPYYALVLDSGEVAQDIDFGSFQGFQPAEIHGAKWNDLNADGVWDAGEPGLADWIIYLDANGNGQVDVGERWARTDADGTYRLTDLAAGDYTVAEVIPDGWVQSYPSSSGVPGTHQVSLSEGQIVENINFGNWQAAEIHGAKWNDLDADGVWDAGEPGLAGWTIYLDQNGNGELDDGEPSTETLADDPATTEIDETGMYAFIDLFQGDYIVREVLQEGWDQSSPAGGAYVLTLAPGDILLEQDFGNYQLASISGHKWNDADVDGVWDAGEPPLEGQTIYVDLDNDGQWDDPDEPSAVTASDGSYTIGDVKPGEYTIRAVTDSGWFSSLPIVGPGAEFRVNTTAAGDQQRPTIAMAPDGSSVIAWQGIMDVAHNEILLQRYSADGTPVGDEIRHTPSTGTPYDNPAMAMDTEGNVSIAYRYGVSAYEWIAIGRYWADGTERGGLTATNVRGDYSSPSVAVSRDGKLAAVWRNSSSEVYARIWDVDDTTLAGPFQVDSSGAYATVAWGRDDQFIVAWQQGEEIYARIYEVDGTPVGDAFRVNTYTSGVQAAPSIASDGIGNFVVSWYSNEQDGEGGGIFARLYRADGTPAGEEFQVNTHWEGAQIAPSVSMQPDGHFVIAWQSRYQDGDGYGIYAQAFRPDGAPLGREMQVNTYTLGDQSDPSVTVSMSEEYGLGDFIVTWQSDDQDGDGTGIYARRFSPATPYYALVLDSGEMAQDIDFGSFQRVTLSGMLFEDLNSNGAKDEGEPGLADRTIVLDLDSNESVNMTTQTLSDGTYSFSNVGPGTHRLLAVQQTGWMQTTPDPAAITVVSGQDIAGINFGNVENVPPTDISLSLNSLAENQPAGALVGRLTTTDLTVGDSHVYALVNTASYPDNEFFTIDASGNLLTTTSFDYEARPFCSICVQTTDTGGLSFEKSLHIAVRDLNERPVLDFNDYVPIDSHGAGQDSPGGYAVEDGGATLQLTGNHWKKIDYSYTITANTILEFDFWSSVQGEIQGIGFDTDDVASSETVFQLYGTQTWGLQDHNDYVGPGVKHYVIPVGQFFTGDMSRLVFVNDDDAGDAGVSYFSNVKVYEMDLVVQVQDELQAYALKGYSVQDELTTDSYVGDDSRSLRFVGNAWKKVELSYTVTAATILEFDYQSSTEGEIQGIGFDTDESLSPGMFFQLYGTQTWGLQAYRDYAGSPGAVKHYVISVGEFFTGSMTRLVFGGDDDAAASAENVFSNLRVYEPELNVEVRGTMQPLVVTGYSVQDVQTKELSTSDDFQSLRFIGNTWKKVALGDAYTVTANTILEFDFQSSDQGEIQGIGFDNDAILSPEWFFQVYGTQTWGLQANRDYASAAGSVKHYVIPIGNFFQGPMSYLILAADDDASAAAEVVFSDLRIYEPKLEVEVQGVVESYLVNGYGDQDVLTREPSFGDPAPGNDGFESLQFAGNAWKKVVLDSTYTVTANTILEFDFQSTAQGEIQGIGFDNDQTLSAETFFQLYGTQTWGKQAYRNYAASAGEVVHYVIPVGQYFQGDLPYLVLSCDDDADASGEVTFSNLRIYEPKLTVEVQSVSESLGITSYADQDVLVQRLSMEDATPGTDGFQTLQFAGNTWKKVALDSAYMVTANTILEFDFQSSVQGEIQGIGFDNDEVLSDQTFFQLYGTQKWGLQAYRNYASSAGETVHYAIPVGEFFSGAMSYLIFAGDDDAHALAENWFSNIRLYEGESEAPLMVSAGLLADQASVTNENTTLDSRLASDQASPSDQSAVSIDPLLLDSLLSRDSRTSLKSMAARRSLGPWEVEPTEPESSARSAVGVLGDSGNRFQDEELWKWSGPNVRQQVQDRALAELFDSSSRPDQDDDPLPNSDAIGHERLAELLPKWEQKR